MESQFAQRKIIVLDKIDESTRVYENYSASYKIKEKRDTKGNDVGGGAGYGNTLFYLDTHGTIMAPGCYEDSLEDLVNKGFLPDAHGAAYNYNYPNKAVMGYFDSAREDANGLWVEWTFHSDEHSQDLRNKLAEREAAGKTCGMSIGFMVGNGISCPKGWTYAQDEVQPEDIDYIRIEAKDFSTQIPRWSTAQTMALNMERASDMWCVYILLRITVSEVSPTLVPANEASLIEEIRSTKVSKPAARKTRASKTSQLNQLFTMALEQRDDTRDDAAREAHEKMARALKRAKESHDDTRDALDEAAKHARTLKRALDKRDEEDDKGGEEEDKRAREILRKAKALIGKE